MIIAHIHGGLGNQLFQYAFARGLAERHQTELKLDLGYFGSSQRPDFADFHRVIGLFNFNVTGAEATPREIARLRGPGDTGSLASRVLFRARRIKRDFLRPASYIRQPDGGFHPEFLDLPDDVYVLGYWQSEQYFKTVEAMIRREFTLKDAAVRERAEAYVSGHREAGVPLVSLHVRRGDLAYAQEILKDSAKVFGSPASLDYYARARSEFGEGCKFLVFSDSAKDIAWCKANLSEGPGRLAFSEGGDDIDDFTRMQCCDHHITANSTFSWWAAWLNDKAGKRVYTPKEWTHVDESGVPMKSDMAVMVDLIPHQWKRLS